MNRLTHLFAIVLCVAATPSLASVITFDGLGTNTQKPVVVDGFEFDYIDENGWCICDTASSSAQISNGTDQILVRDTGDRDASITMRRDGGGVFSLNSFLGADGLLGIGGRTIEVTGSLFGGGTIVQSFQTIADTQSQFDLLAGFTGLTSVRFHSFGSRGDGLALDNITIDEGFASNVPAPATLGLLGLGLVALRRRRHMAA